MTRDDFLASARIAADLLRRPAVAEAWSQPSALDRFGVSGLAGHLAYQILAIPQILAEPVPSEPTVPLLEHYARVAWIGSGLDEEINVRIRGGGDAQAAEGPETLATRVDAVLKELSDGLAAEPNRPVRIPLWGPWSLTLDDMLITRTMELLVHSDDLAVSVGIATPEFPDTAVETVIALLSTLSVRRHGPVSVLRALSRAERAPASIAAF